ncbi:MAG: hypothetical protein ACI8PT_005012 [Gammaproteobacteria bacterium]
MEIKLSIEDSLSGFNKILDFQDLSSDVGPYALGGAIDFFTIGPAAGSLALNTDFIVGLARAADTVEVFSLFTVSDPLGQAVSAANILNFFEDDLATS